jgi:hypothetical protein
MDGLRLEARVRLCQVLERRVLEQPRMPDGSLALLVTPADLRVLQALALDFHNGRSGRCDPGYRAIAARARCALGTVHKATRRLQAAGWITWRRVLRYVHGQLRWARAYELAGEAPDLRSRHAPKPREEKKGLGRWEQLPRQRPVREQLRELGLEISREEAAAGLAAAAAAARARLAAAWQARRGGG